MSDTSVAVFCPNGVVSGEVCPACGSDSTVEHGHSGILFDDEPLVSDLAQHFWHCPECGDTVVLVVHECPHCAEVSGDRVDS